MTTSARARSAKRARLSTTSRGVARVADPVLEFIRVMWAVDHELQSISRRMVLHMGLTAPQRLAVRFIGLYEGLTLGALTRLLHLHPGTVTGIVNHLHEAGLVARARSTLDTRRVHLRLTPRGRRLNRRTRGTVEAAVRRALGDIPAGRMDAAADVMRRIARELAVE